MFPVPGNIWQDNEGVADDEYAAQQDTKREWKAALREVTLAAFQDSRVDIEDEHLDIDHELQQVAWRWDVRVDSLSLHDLANALESAAAAIRKAAAL